MSKPVVSPLIAAQPKESDPRQIAKQSPARVRNRRRVLNAASALVTEHGLEALTMRRLAAEAEVSVATLYNLIGGRDDIVRALGLYFLEELNEAYAEASAPDPIAKAQEILNVLINNVSAQLPRPLLLKLLSDSQLYEELIPDWKDPLADTMREMVASGVLEEEINIDIVSKQVWWSQLGYMRQWAAGRLEEHELRAAVQHNLVLCLLALSTPAGREDLLQHARVLEKNLHRL